MDWHSGIKKYIVPVKNYLVGSLIKIGIIIVIGLLCYNYFLGDETEKAQSREIVGKATNLGKEAWNLLKSEKAKMEEGKYDGALEKLGVLYNNLKASAAQLKDSDTLHRIRELDKQRKELEEQFKDADEATRKEAAESVDELTKATEALMEKLEGQTQPSN